MMACCLLYPYQLKFQLSSFLFSICAHVLHALPPLSICEHIFYTQALWRNSHNIWWIVVQQTYIIINHGSRKQKQSNGTLRVYIEQSNLKSSVDNAKYNLNTKWYSMIRHSNLIVRKPQSAQIMRKKCSNTSDKIHN